jgi:hypothetical protein
MKQRVTEWANKFQKKTPVLVTSYEMVRKFVKELAAAQAGLLICDEAHRLKKTGGNKTISDLNSLGCTRRVLCTGYVGDVSCRYVAPSHVDDTPIQSCD